MSITKEIKEESQDKRTAALEATLKLIATQGFHATPMSQIAQQANISVGTIYHYFDSKEELLNELYVHIKIGINNIVKASISQNATMKENFLSIGNNLYQHYLEKPNELLFVEQYSNSPLITAAYHEKICHLFEPQHKSLEKAIQDGIIKNLPIEMIMALIHGAMHSLMKFYLSHKEHLSEDIINKGFEAIWDMLKK